MTRNAVIEQLYLSKDFNDCINKMQPDHIRDDLRAEVIAQVCEWPEEKVLGLWQRGELIFYVVRVIINMLRNTGGPFCKKFRRPVYELSGHEVADDSDIQALKERERLGEQAMKNIDRLYWYDAAMVRLYLEAGSFRAMEERTQIPYSSAFKTVKKSLEALKTITHEDR